MIDLVLNKVKAEKFGLNMVSHGQTIVYRSISWGDRVGKRGFIWGTDLQPLFLAQKKSKG